MKNNLILWSVLLVLGFLGGFVPQFMKAGRLETDLRTAERKLGVCEQSARFSQFRDLAAVMYLETARKNYGVAAEAAGRFFQGLRQCAGHIADPELSKRLEEVLNSRDSITAGLAKADPGVLSEMESLLLQTQQKLKP
jgi:hypothetical protein